MPFVVVVVEVEVEAEEEEEGSPSRVVGPRLAARLIPPASIPLVTTCTPPATLPLPLPLAPTLASKNTTCISTNSFSSTTSNLLAPIPSGQSVRLPPFIFSEILRILEGLERVLIHNNQVFIKDYRAYVHLPPPLFPSSFRRALSLEVMLMLLLMGRV